MTDQEKKEITDRLQEINLYFLSTKTVLASRSWVRVPPLP
jgi:hypothetical protein